MKKELIVMMIAGIFVLNPVVIGESHSDGMNTYAALIPPLPSVLRTGTENNVTSLPGTTFSNVQVSHDSPEANEICLKSGENGVYYMGWNDYRDVDWSSGYVHLGFSYSMDGGRTWSENQILANKTPGDMHDCAGDPLIIPGSGDTVYYVMMEYNETEVKQQGSLAHNQLAIIKSDDHGQTWSNESVIWPYDVDKPWGDYYNGNVYVAWDNVSIGNVEFSHTINGDITHWASKVSLPGGNGYPYVCINETGVIFVATVHWSGNDWDQMAVSISTNGGGSFGTQKVVGSVGRNSWESDPRSYPIPSMAVNGSDIYVVWANNDTHSVVRLSESHDGGKSWHVTDIGDVTGKHIRYMYPSVSVEPNGRVHLEYYRFNTSTKEIDVIYRDYMNGDFGEEVIVDSWTNQNHFIGDYSSIDYNEVTGDIGIGYTAETPSDNAMFARRIPPIEVNVHGGWNLISLPWQKSNVNISTTLSGINWTRAMIYRDGTWYTYNNARPTKYNIGFPDIDNTEGIWVYSTANGTLYGPGTNLGNRSIDLHKGWNLVGYPSSNNTRTVEDVLSGVSYVYVQAYNTSSGQIETLTPSDIMEPGKGYWIYVTEDSTWTVSW